MDARNRLTCNVEIGTDLEVMRRNVRRGGNFMLGGDQLEHSLIQSLKALQKMIFTWEIDGNTFKLYKQYVQGISASGMQSNHGFEGDINACWTHKVTLKEIDTIRSAGFLISVIHGRKDVIAQIGHARRVAEKLHHLARMVDLHGGHLGSHERTNEESPFSNFINSLSPIKSSKGARISQTFGGLSFSSPPSVFTSPQINLQRESRFVRRDQLPGLSKSESSSDNENKDVTHEDASKAKNWRSSSENQVQDSINEGSSEDAPSEASNPVFKLPRKLKYEGGISTFQTAPSFGCEMKSEPGTSSSRVPLFQESSRIDSFGAQLSPVE